MTVVWTRPLVALVAVVCLGALQARAPFEPTIEEVALASEALRLLNAARHDAGLAPLQSDAAASLLAYQHAREMASRGRVTHHSYLWGVSTASRVRLAFPDIYQFAENVAANRDVTSLHEGLTRSPLHRANRLEAVFTHVGIGVAVGNDRRLYQTEVFMAVAGSEPLRLATLYTTVPADQLPRDEATSGEVASETITVGAAGEDDPEFWTNRGIDAFNQARYAAAIESFEHALRLQPDYRYASFNLGRALLAAGRAAEARDLLESLLADDPGDVDALASLASAQLLGGDYAGAEKSLRAVLGVRLRDANAWYNLGLALEYQRRASDAERAYAQAVHLDPTLQAAIIALQRVRR